MLLGETQPLRKPPRKIKSAETIDNRGQLCESSPSRATAAGHGTAKRVPLIFDNLVMNLSAEFKSVRDRSYKMANRCDVLPSVTEQ